ncbi:unnamed protein product [Strongylus vulgaris]|uniref:PDZ domain-containing protein n=1 Tax=Strongylus vulgaris TaxID=40348 RepID=A0A3P7JP60_STRVU|nr:unnamed protein product [Strongylus vulgaris]
MILGGIIAVSYAYGTKTEKLSTEGGGLGFGIVGGTSTGVVVKTILPGSPADKVGDFLIFLK